MPATGTMVVKSKARPRQRLHIAAQLEPDGFGNLLVTVDSEGLRADLEVITYWGDGLDGYLRRLESNRRGWVGVRRWTSLEGELAIEATHRGDAIELVVILRQCHRPDSWVLRFPFEVEPIAELPDIASAAAAMVRRAVVPV